MRGNTDQRNAKYGHFLRSAGQLLLAVLYNPGHNILVPYNPSFSTDPINHK